MVIIGAHRSMGRELRVVVFTRAIQEMSKFINEFINQIFTLERSLSLFCSFVVEPHLYTENLLHVIA